jgi:hypothetical protein
MAVPEAAMHKDDRVVAGKDDIRAARELCDIQSKSQALGVQGAPEKPFYSRIPAANLRHHLTAFRG